MTKAVVDCRIVDVLGDVEVKSEVWTEQGMDVAWEKAAWKDQIGTGPDGLRFRASALRLRSDAEQSR